MANNRMWLVNKKTGDQVLLAKYYPSAGWGTFWKQELAEKIDALFTKNLQSPTMIGDMDYEIVYEE